MSEVYAPQSLSQSTEPMAFDEIIQQARKNEMRHLSDLTNSQREEIIVERLADPIFRKFPNPYNNEASYHRNGFSQEEEEFVINGIHNQSINAVHFEALLSSFPNPIKKIYAKESVSETESHTKQQLSQMITRQALNLRSGPELLKNIFEQITPGTAKEMQGLDEKGIFESGNIIKINAILRNILLNKCPNAYAFQEQIDIYIKNFGNKYTNQDLKNLIFDSKRLLLLLYGEDQNNFLHSIISLQKKAHVRYLGQELDEIVSRIEIGEKNTVSVPSVRTTEPLPSDFFKEKGKQFVRPTRQLVEV